MGQQASVENKDHILKTDIGCFKGVKIIDEQSGKVIGFRYSNIRYSKPVVGDNRWRKPVPLEGSYKHASNGSNTQVSGCPQPYIKSTMLSFLNGTIETCEDCNYLDVWVPGSVMLSDTSIQKFPIFFYIHGGWLQYGSRKLLLGMDPSSFFKSERLPDKYIIVAPGYRLNALGFLATQQLVNEGRGLNFGFWDQRMALEWTYNNIHYFGGDQDKITIGGLSAGSYSAFFQLAYEVYHPHELQIIKQVVHFSNCVLFQPKLLEDQEGQFEELCAALGINLQAKKTEQLSLLEKVTPEDMMKVIPDLKLHTFRAVTDDDFISSSLLADIYSGKYGIELRNKGTKIIIGEVANEEDLYSYLNTPTSIEDLSLQLVNYYPSNAVPKLLDIYKVEQKLKDSQNFKEDLRKIFGKIVADSQVYSSTRGYVYCLTNNGQFPNSSIFRFKSSFNPEYKKKELEKVNVEGPIHGDDQCLWFFGIHAGATEQEEIQIYNFIQPLSKFVSLEDIESIWGTCGPESYRHFLKNGNVAIECDPDFDKGVGIAKTIYKLQV